MRSFERNTLTAIPGTLLPVRTATNRSSSDDADLAGAEAFAPLTAWRPPTATAVATAPPINRVSAARREIRLAKISCNLSSSSVSKVISCHFHREDFFNTARFEWQNGTI